MASAYNQNNDSDWLEIPAGEHYFYISCCDCGLVHKAVTKSDKPFKMTFSRNERRTAQRRRHGNVELIHGPIGKWALVRVDDNPSR